MDAGDLASPETPESPDRSKIALADLLASIVVFLVALPLCIGLAMASGVPVERGLITGIVGGIVVGAFTGSPLLVSGPAASLLVLVWDLVATHGLGMLGPVVVGAGLIQMIAGRLGLGQWFRAVSPAVIQGMMAGIGVLIVASQLHVVLDGAPGSSFYANLSTFPAALGQALAEARPALGVGLLTVGVLLGWARFRPARLKLVPPQLVAVVLVVAACQAFGLEVLYLEVSGSLMQGIQVTDPGALRTMVERGLLVHCLIFAFVASAATLLTATAIDQVQSEVQTDYDQELFAQGLGNAVAGGLGGLPMTGVIVRSSANVEAGARTRLSTLLHGVWLLVFVVIFPGLLGLIPKATLAAILVVVGLKLAHPEGMKKLEARGRSELVVGLVTLAGVVGLDLFSGILLGLGASVLRLVYAFTRFEVRVEPGQGKRYDVHLSGFATFLKLPRLAQALDAVPAGSRVTVHLQRLDYADHACFEQIAATERRLRGGGGALEVEWEELLRRYKEGPAPAGADPRLERQVGSLQRHLVAARRALEMSPPELEQVAGHLELSPERVFLDLPGGELGPALREVAGALIEDLPDRGPEFVEGLFGTAGEQALALGEGVILVHAYQDGLAEKRLGFARLEVPLRLSSGSGDLLFVLLDQRGDPEGHILALAGLARICASPARLEALRRVQDPAEAAAVLAAGFLEAEAEDRTPSAPASGSHLAVVELAGGREASRALRDALQRSFGTVAIVGPGADPSWALLAGVVGLAGDAELLLVDVPPRLQGLLEALVEEFSRTSDAGAPRVHLLQPSPGAPVAAARAVNA